METKVYINYKQTKKSFKLNIHYTIRSHDKCICKDFGYRVLTFQISKMASHSCDTMFNGLWQRYGHSDFYLEIFGLKKPEL